ncbi:hypothetical protein [Actinoallomurus rhizosphaericola]|nr:hypothetical protein [Actinoallomurus rhizosphaericola]
MTLMRVRDGQTVASREHIDPIRTVQARSDIDRLIAVLRGEATA